MNIIKNGSQYQIYGDDLATMKTLPIGTYDLSFQKFIGFYLETRPDLDVKEEKVYGMTEAKTEKILAGYKDSARNFGVILSGPKGVGKTLFARRLTEKCIDAGYPVIIISQYFHGIADFLASLEQEVVILFDEFEKTFANQEDVKPMEEMLSLFDGTNNGKKLFVVTCNEYRKLNDCMLDRPGRFYYHFEMVAPGTDEICEYMRDNLHDYNQNTVDTICSYALQTSMTYDCLRAIAAELNRGYSLDESMKDLNITRNIDGKYIIKVTLNNGQTSSDDIYAAKLLDGDFSNWFIPAVGADFRVGFDTENLMFDYVTGGYFIDPAQSELEFARSDFKSDEEYQKTVDEVRIKSINIIPQRQKNIRRFR